MGKNLNIKQGFTLIEVVLVLAIGGLIILMALVVFPNAMANLNDTQRREDYAQLATNVNQYSSSNNGKIIRLVGTKAKLSDDACRTLDAATYINSTGEDPDGYPYTLIACTYKGWQSTQNSKIPVSDNTGTEVFLVIGADCDGESDDEKVTFSIPGENNSTKAYAVFGGLQTGSKTYCNANMTTNDAGSGDTDGDA